MKTAKLLLTAILILAIIYSAFPITAMSLATEKEVYQHNLEIYKKQGTDSATLEFYKLPERNIQSDAKEIIDLAGAVTKGISDDYAKAKAIHDWVIDNIWYDKRVPDADIVIEGLMIKQGTRIYGALETLKYKYGVCSNYSALTAALLKSVGIPTKLVYGLALGASEIEQRDKFYDLDSTVINHVWVEAFIDGRWIIIDATWDCRKWIELDGTYTDFGPGIDDYFDISLEKLSINHKYIDYSLDFTLFDFTNIASITIPDNITSIGDSAFAFCTSLTSITIPDSVKSIGSGAFLMCTSLASITIPDNVTSIGSGAFDGCTSLMSITIPDSITNIEFVTFARCTSLTSITIPDSVTSIEEGAFFRCTNLTSITIPDSVTSIGDVAFYECPELTIYGKAGSYAEKYAKENKLTFVVGNPQFIATPTPSTVLVNGQKTVFDAYNINGSNYFKLRDLAYVLNGTAKQFEVNWDDTKNAILLISGKPYFAIGGEMAAKSADNKVAAPTTSNVYVDGKEIKITAYTIDGNNYFKLRNIGLIFNFGVTWDGATNTIMIDTSIDYTS